MVDLRVARGEATREQLLEAARRLFGERGYEATSIEAVLDSAGVARGALYHHFDSKADLFDAVAVRVFVEIAEETADAARAHDEPLQRLRAGSHAWLQMALDPAVQRIALVDPPTVLGWSRWRALDEQYTLGGLRSGFRRLAGEGRIPRGQDELLAHLLLAALNEAALFIGSASDQPAALTSARAAVDTLLDRLAGGPVGGLGPLGGHTRARH
jgi:AcrR family transcriptional regulator